MGGRRRFLKDDHFRVQARIKSIFQHFIIICVTFPLSRSRFFFLVAFLSHLSSYLFPLIFPKRLTGSLFPYSFSQPHLPLFLSSFIPL